MYDYVKVRTMFNKKMKGELRGVKTLLFLGPLKTPYSLLLLQGIQRHTSSVSTAGVKV